MCRTHTACGSCDNCLKVTAHAHQDVISVPTDVDKNRITVADVAYVVEESYKRPVDNSDCRVFLINAVDSLAGVGCEVWQNKLLKTLEEPNAGCYIFIGVTDAESLLPTVRSRCQVIKQDKLSRDEIEQKLLSRGYDALSCRMAAVTCSGSLSSAERIVSNPQILGAYRLALDTAANMTSTKVALGFASQILALKDNIDDFLLFYTLALRESIVLRLSPELCVLQPFSDELDKICANYTIAAAQDGIERLVCAKRQLANGGNVPMVVDRLLVDMLQIRYTRREDD